MVTVHLRGTWLGVREASAATREAGIAGLTEVAAKELAHHNVRVNDLIV